MQGFSSGFEKFWCQLFSLIDNFFPWEILGYLFGIFCLLVPISLLILFTYMFVSESIAINKNEREKSLKKVSE